MGIPGGQLCSLLLQDLKCQYWKVGEVRREVGVGLERPAECWLVEAEHPEREQGGGTGSRWPPGSCFDSWVGKVPWRRDRLPTPVFWPGELHGLYSPWGRKESGMTERHSKKKGTCWGFHHGSGGKQSTCNAGDTGSSGLILGWGRFPGGGDGNEGGNRQNRLHLESRTPSWAGLWTLS